MKFVDLRKQYLSIKKEIDRQVKEVIESGQFILGPKTAKLEEEVARLVGVKYAVGVNSGTDALILSLKALNIGGGDEVITASFSFFATAEAVALTGAKPVFVDIEPKTYNINPDLIEKAITPKTKAIIPVHLYGQMAEMTPILEIATKYKLAVIEDAAQALGAEQQGFFAGSLGDCGCFSFFPTKNLGAFGDGGMITTNNSHLAQSLRLLRAHGQESKYRHRFIGVNSRLDEIQAAVLLAKLPYLNEWNKRRQMIAETYNAAFAQNKFLITPAALAGNNHIYHQYTLRSPFRNQIVNKLKTMDVPAAIHYPTPIHLQPAFNRLGYKKGDFPTAEKAANEVFSLPIHPELAQQEIDKIMKSVLLSTSEFRRR